MTLNRKIRIALVSETTVGGVRRQIVNLARFLNSDIFDLTLFLPESPRTSHSGEGTLLQDVSDLNIKCEQIPIVRKISPFQDLRALRALSRHLDAQRFDLVHARASKAGFLSRLSCRRSGIPCVYSPHVFAFQRSTGLTRLLYRGLEKWAAQWTASYVVNSEMERQAILEMGEVSTEKIFLIRNAVEPPDGRVAGCRSSIRKTLNTNENRIVFLLLGRLVKYKGQANALEAFAKYSLKDFNCELWIAGEGEDYHHLQQLSERLQIKNETKFLGFRRDVYSLLEAADCFVLASQIEGSPNTLLEALAMEKPIIATNVPGTNELITDPAYCRLVPWNDSDALGDAMRSYAMGPYPGIPRSNLPAPWFDVKQQINEIEKAYLQTLGCAS